jgi:glycosyltransferase involved in cell wall biosynthesis
VIRRRGDAPKRLNPSTLVVVAYACDPDQGSEPGAGWAAVVAASEIFARIIVITRPQVDSRLRIAARGLECDVDILTIATPFDRFGAVHVRYSAWIVGAARCLRRLIRGDASVRVIHHVTYASDWMVSPVALIPRRRRGDVRVVWGPVGGATYAPRGLLRLFPRKLRLGEARRRLLTTIVRSLTLRRHRTIVDVAVALNPDTARALTSFRRVEMSPNIALDVTTFPEPDTGRERVVVFAGRPLEWKGIRLVLDALPHARENWTLELYGGDIRDFQPYGDVDDPRVAIMGRVERSHLLRRLGQVSALVLPSLHDSAGWVAAEAASMRTPVVCLDLGGVSTMAGAFAMPVAHAPAESLAKRLAIAIDSAVANPPFTDDTPTPDWSGAAYSAKLRDWYGR